MCGGTTTENPGHAPDCYPRPAPTPQGGWRNERRGWLRARLVDLVDRVLCRVAMRPPTDRPPFYGSATIRQRRL